MNFKGKEKLVSFVEKIHIRIFGHNMSDVMRGFLNNLSWSVFGGVIFGGLLFLVNILVGRYLGPEDFGKYNIIIVIGQFFIIPMLLGLDIASVRFISKTQKNDEKKQYVSASFIAVALATFIFGLLFLIFRENLAGLMNVDINIILSAILVGCIAVFKMLFDGYIRGFCLFKYQAIVKIIEATGVLLGVLAIIFLVERENYIYFVFATVVGSAIAIILYFIKMYKYISFDINIKYIQKLFQYSKFVVIGAILGIVFTFGDKFLINTYLGSEELGIYVAYYTVSITVIAQLSLVTINVFFPGIASLEDKMEIMKKINKLMYIGFVPLVIILSFFIFFMMQLFGVQYPVLPQLVILFAILGSLQFFVPFLASIVKIHSRQTYFWGLSLLAMRSIFFIIYVTLLILFDYFTMYTLLLGIIANYVVDIFNLRFIIKKYARRKI
jgi:O-antigen/teichoic acid export membrane protein